MTANPQLLDAAFNALADPTRRAILARLSKGEATVNALVDRFELSQPAISRHLKVLEKAGMITRGRDAQKRPCRLAPVGLREAASWIDPYRQLWETRLEQLDAYLKAPADTREGTRHD